MASGIGSQTQISMDQPMQLDKTTQRLQTKSAPQRKNRKSEAMQLQVEAAGRAQGLEGLEEPGPTQLLEYSLPDQAPETEEEEETFDEVTGPSDECFEGDGGSEEERNIDELIAMDCGEGVPGESSPLSKDHIQSILLRLKEKRDLTKMVWMENEKCWFCNICRKKKHSEAARHKHSRQNCANTPFHNPSWQQGWDRKTMSCRYCGMTGFRQQSDICEHIQGKVCPMLPDWNKVFGKTPDLGQAERQSWRARNQEWKKKANAKLLQLQAAKRSKGHATSNPPRAHQKVTATVRAGGRARLLGLIPGRARLLGQIPRRAILLGPIPRRARLPGSIPRRTLLPGPIPRRARLPGPIPRRARLPGPIPRRTRLPGSIPRRARLPGPIPRRARLPGPILGRAGFPGPLPLMECLPNLVPGPQLTQGWRGGPQFPGLATHLPQFSEPASLQDQHSIPLNALEERGNDCYDPFQQRVTRRLDPYQSERGNIRDDLCPERNTRRWDLNLAERGTDHDNSYTERDTRPGPHRDERGNDRYNPYRERGTRPGPLRAERGNDRDNPYRGRGTRPDPYRAERGNDRDDLYDERDTIRSAFYGGERGSDCGDLYHESNTSRPVAYRGERCNDRDDPYRERDTRSQDPFQGERMIEHDDPYGKRDTRLDPSYPYRGDKGKEYDPYREIGTRPDPYRAERGNDHNDPYRERGTRPDPYRAESGNDRDDPYRERGTRRPYLNRGERTEYGDAQWRDLFREGGLQGRDDDMRRPDFYRKDPHRVDSDTRRFNPYRDHFTDRGPRDLSPVGHRETLDWHRSGSRNR